MSEKLQEKIDKVIKNRNEYLNKIRFYDLRNKGFFVKRNDIYKKMKKEIGWWKSFIYLKGSYKYCLSPSLLELARNEINLDFQELLDLSYSDGSYSNYFKYDDRRAQKLDYESWQKFKKIGDFLIKHQDKLIENIEIATKKEELYRLTHCQKIYDQMSDCDQICELCGNIIKIGEKCSCIELEVK